MSPCRVGPIEVALNARESPAAARTLLDLDAANTRLRLAAHVVADEEAVTREMVEDALTGSKGN